MNKIYNPKEIEPRWQKYWQENKTYKTPQSGEKQYVLGMFPYPSGDGLHVGHVRIYTGTDVLSRFLRMNGKKVLHPMGWDAFGLPTENAAVKANINPKILAHKNIENFRRQMQMIGLGYDWAREFATTDPNYYRWTQWLFLKLYSLKNNNGKRLIYRKTVPINWCQSCKTGLANEEVLANGTHERCGQPVTQRKTEQWLMRITDYADRLLEDLKGLDWPNGILEMQRNWIGRSEGLEIEFPLEFSTQSLVVFTTRPDTIFSVTFICIAPDHEIVKTFSVPPKFKNDVNKYIENTLKKTDQSRASIGKMKTGVFTGLYAKHPLTKQKIPIWLSDFILKDYGTGAIMGVPAYDQRDYEFAKIFDIPIVKNKLENIKNISQQLINQKISRKIVNYHLRDWIFSRQHYWGEPIPLIYCPKCGDENGVVPVPEDHLPIELPDVEKFKPTATGKSPLSEISNWVNIKCPKCGGKAKRETDTMPNWAGSCWYFLRFADPDNLKQAFSSTAIRKWMPVDWYLGGAEHAVLHLLYTRFWIKAFYDLGLLDINEPFTRLRSVGMVLGEGHAKMSKSLGNVINPDEIVNMFGADTLRIYEMFMGPWNQSIAWSTKNLAGSYRFIEKIYNLIFVNHHQKVSASSSPELVSKLHQLIKKVAGDISAIHFNTSVAEMMKFVNSWEEKNNHLNTKDVSIFAQVLAPFAPHLAEEIWYKLGQKGSIHQSSWPKYNENLIKNQTVNFPVQINGKTRAVISVNSEETQIMQVVIQKAKQHPNISRYLDKTENIKPLFVSGKILNFIVK